MQSSSPRIPTLEEMTAVLHVQSLLPLCILWTRTGKAIAVCLTILRMNILLSSAISNHKRRHAKTTKNTKHSCLALQRQHCATAPHPLKALSKCVRWWNRSRNYRSIDFISSAIRLRVARWASTTTVVTVCLRLPCPHHEVSFVFFHPATRRSLAFLVFWRVKCFDYLTLLPYPWSAASARCWVSL